MFLQVLEVINFGKGPLKANYKFVAVFIKMIMCACVCCAGWWAVSGVQGCDTGGGDPG